MKSKQGLFVALFFLILSQLVWAAELKEADFGNLRRVAERIVLDETNRNYPSWSEWTPDEIRQIFFAQLASLPGFQTKIKLSDADLIDLKRGEAHLSDHQAKELFEFLKQQQGVYFQQFMQVLSRHTPPKSRHYVVTTESLKAFVALNAAFAGAILLGTGIVSYDSDLGQMLAPIATLASVIAVTRPIKVLLELGRLENQTKEFEQHMRQLHKHAELKIPGELLTASFLLQSYELLQKRACSYVLETDLKN